MDWDAGQVGNESRPSRHAARSTRLGRTVSGTRSRAAFSGRRQHAVRHTTGHRAPQGVGARPHDPAVRAPGESASSCPTESSRPRPRPPLEGDRTSSSRRSTPCTTSTSARRSTRSERWRTSATPPRRRGLRWTCTHRRRRRSTPARLCRHHHAARGHRAGTEGDLPRGDGCPPRCHPGPQRERDVLLCREGRPAKPGQRADREQQRWDRRRSLLARDGHDQTFDRALARACDRLADLVELGRFADPDEPGGEQLGGHRPRRTRPCRAGGGRHVPDRGPRP